MRPEDSPQDSTQFVWHYTTLGTLINILQSRTLYATEVNFMNDIHEPTLAKVIFEKILADVAESNIFNAKGFVATIKSYLEHGESYSHSYGELPQSANSRFILCGSVNPDSLYAWRTYAAKGDVACAIALDRRVPLRPKAVAPNRNLPLWRDVEYDDEVVHREVLAELTQMAKDHNDEIQKFAGDAMPPFDGMDKLADLEEYCKDSSFSHEEEARITYTDPSLSDLRFVVHPMGPRPHLPLGVRGKKGDRSTNEEGWSKLPIRKVKLGPEAPDSAISSVKWLLEANGYQTVPSPGYLLDAEGKLVEDSDGHPIPNGPDYSDVVEVEKSNLPYRTT